MVVHVFDARFWEAEAGGSLSLRPDWPIEFQDGPCYTEKPCLQKKKRKKKNLFNQKENPLFFFFCCVSDLHRLTAWIYYNLCFTGLWRCDEIIRNTEIYFEDMLKHINSFLFKYIKNWKCTLKIIIRGIKTCFTDSNFSYETLLVYLWKSYAWFKDYLWPPCQVLGLISNLDYC